MTVIWELDFYSRPILDENQKKLWEVLICESPLDVNASTDSLFKYSQFCSSKTVNSIFLREAIENAIAQAPSPPKKIRFFRRQMNNMITKACEDAGIPPIPSRRTYALQQWLDERMEQVYPNEPGYEPEALIAASVQYQSMPAIPLPDAVKGDRADKWAFVSLEASAFDEMNEWEIGFQEAFPLAGIGISPDTRIPGLIIFSPRAIALAAWMSGLELAFLKFDEGKLPRLRLETGFNDNWILADVKDPKIIAEGKGFEAAKQKANGVHFLAVQSNPESEDFAGFWLLKEG